jgi:hypothetical protein
MLSGTNTLAYSTKVPVTKKKKVDNIFQQNQYEVPHLPVARYGQVYGEQHYPYGGRQHLVHY